MNKITEEKTVVYKPEFECCPICSSRLMYRYTVSNKIIQFSSGSYIRVKNLGYSCSNQDCIANSVIFTSQTASKLCVKGYTYSAKVLAMIYVWKEEKISREEICDKLAMLGIEISDRNIDIIHNKYKELLELPYLENIKTEYQYMMAHYNQIVLSIDSIVVEKYRIISIRNSFNNDQIGLHIVDAENQDKLISLLHAYVDYKGISAIVTVRRQTQFFQLLDRAVNRKMKYYYFIKY